MEEESNTKKFIEITWRVSTVILSFICINIFLTILRNEMHDKIPSDYFSFGLKIVLYVLITIPLILFFVSYIITSISNARIRRETFFRLSDYIVFTVSLSITTNYWFVNTPVSMWTGNVLSDLFDISMFFSCCIILYFTGEILARIQKSKQEKKEKKEKIAKSLQKENKIEAYYNSEYPIKDTEQDALNRASFAEKIANSLVKSGEDSLTMGILGNWGSGKSSVYNLIKEKSDENHVIFIEFKPWYFGENNHDIIGLYLLEFLEGIKKVQGYNPEIGKAIKKYADILSSVSLRGFGTIISFKELVDRFKPGQSTDSLSDLKKEIEMLLKDYPKRIVVYIDDIDRLEGSEIRMIFKLVRLVADFPKVTYILALDEEVVQKSLSSVYQFEEKGNLEDAKKYIEKFIQIPIYLPKPDFIDLYNLCEKQLNNIIEENNILDKNYTEIIDSLIEQKLSLRDVSRYFNLVKFYLPFLKEEVNVKDLLYLILIQVSSPELYQYIYTNKLLFLNNYKFQSDDEFKALTRLNEYKKIICTIFPYALRLFVEDATFEGEKVNEKEWEKEKRVCSVKYFNHYFMYSSPRNAITQNELSNFISLIKEKNLTEIQTIYLNLLKEYNAKEVNEKLEHRLSEVDEYLEKIFTFILKSYQEIHNMGGNRNAKESIVYLAQLIAEKLDLEDHKFSVEYWEDSNILFILKIYKYLQNNYNESNLSNLKLAVKNAYEKNSEVSYFKEFDEFDAKEVFSHWNKFSNQEDIKEKVKKWISTNEEFDEFLNYYFSDILSEKIVNDKELLVRLFVLSTQYLSDEKLQEYFNQYNSLKTKVEWKQYVEKNRTENIGLFILGKNNLFEFIYKLLKQALNLNLKENSPIVFSNYVSIGVNLIEKFGDNEQKMKIENLLNSIKKSNKAKEEQSNF
ncbi:P-loop NTPase fold protein [Bacillus sp. FDAARGOS_235]|uniref:KAP family P-loop NTPase fold protein n=1 Tax=Bacillus sp. FDAARGOS_235 TaxID=1839798 RepID=UPI0011A8E64A|nr:P-loop NTPase fold protein [Bacillus sp. FDAARGOS_235]